MQLSTHFTLEELTFSQTAIRHGINNNPNSKIVDNLTILTLKILQPTRDHYDKPIIITSGYRSPMLNDLIGGAAKSQHMEGRAVDFTVKGIKNSEVITWIKNHLEFDQLIDEFGSWVHCSYHLGNNRKQCFKIG